MSAQIPFVTVAEAARIVGYTRPVLYRAIKEGALKTWRPHARGDQRIHLDELHRWAGTPQRGSNAHTAA